MVDLGDLGLKNGNGVTNGGLLVGSGGDGGSSEGLVGHGSELGLLGAGCKLRKHPLIIIILNCYPLPLPNRADLTSI